VQIVCEKLWNKYGLDLTTGDRSTRGAREIPLSQYVELGGTKGILSGFFTEVLDGLQPEEVRIEALEMLESLVTTTGTRNIVEREVLVRAPFRQWTRRQRALASLVDRIVVRVEPRLGGYFVEITHEFLIQPILKGVRAEITASRFRWGIRALERCVLQNDAGGVLTAEEFRVLHDCRARVFWDDAAREVMLRSGVRLGVARDVLRYWLEELSQPIDDATAAAVEERLEGWQDGSACLSLHDTLRLNAVRDNFALSDSALEAMLRSTLTWATERDRDHVRYWVRKYDNSNTAKLVDHPGVRAIG
jgi:hypothetical protein